MSETTVLGKIWAVTLRYQRRNSYVKCQRQNFHLGSIAQRVKGMESPSVGRGKVWRTKSPRTQKLKQFADIVYRF